MTLLFNRCVDRVSVTLVARPRIYDEELRAALVAAAAEQMARSGPSGLSLRTLAAAVDTSTNAIYTMFGGKPGLIGAVLAAADESFTRSQRLARGEGRTLADLRRLRHDYRDWALAHPTLFSAMFGDQKLLGHEVPLGRDETPESIQPLLDVIGSLIATGVFREADPLIVALSTWAGTHGGVTLEMAFWPGAPFALALFEAHLAASERGWLTPYGLEVAASLDAAGQTASVGHPEAN